MDEPLTERVRPLGVRLFWADVEPLEQQEQSRVEAMLGDEELRRAMRFRHEPSRWCHLVTRQLVRETFSRLGGGAPDRWRFETEEEGRPYLVNPTEKLEGLDFNIAHSHQKVVLAVADSGRVGVDVEPVGRDVDYELVARRFFHDSECDAIDELDAELRHRRFLQLWVLKEAWMKADGRGIGAGLSQVVFEFDRKGQPRLASLPDGADTSRWAIVLGEKNDHLVAVAHRRVVRS